MGKNILWGVIWFIVTMALMVGAAYLWVFIYSITINSSGDQAFYEQYAQMASPVVAVVTAFPVFYLMGRMLVKQVHNAIAVAIGVLAVNLMLEVIVLASLEDTFAYVLPFSVGAGVLKLAGAYFGTRTPGATPADGAA